jgi:membrane-bound serine protease (ClpP class)
VVAFVIALLLAIFVLPSPWGLVAVVVGGAWEIAQVLGGMWWSQRRRASVGAEALVGTEVDVRDPLRPRGSVRVKGELWQARCDEGAAAGERVRIVGLDGLTLVVEPVRPRPEAL